MDRFVLAKHVPFCTIQKDIQQFPKNPWNDSYALSVQLHELRRRLKHLPVPLLDAKKT